MLSTRHIRIVILAFLIAFLGTPAFAQDVPEANPLPRPAVAEKRLRFERLSTRQGLSQNMVLDSAQDELGFMWFATQDGLNRYDGRTFKKFDRIPYDSTSLLSSVVIRLHPSASGMLWVGTGGGLQRYDPATESFEHFSAEEAMADSASRWSCISCYPVSTILEDEGGDLWIGSYQGFASFDPVERTEVVYRHDATDDATLTSSIVTRIHEDPAGDLWVATVNGVNRFDREAERFDRYLYDPEYSPDGLVDMGFGEAPPVHFRKNLAAAFADDLENPGKIWVATLAGLIHLDKTTGEHKRYHPPCTAPCDTGDEEVFTDIVRDPDTPSIYWLTTAAEGLFRFDAESGTFANYRYDDQDLSSISTNRLSSIDVDRNGVMWIGTWSGGVNKLDVDATKFATYSDKPGSVLRLSGSEVWSVAEDERGRIWVGTNPGGLNVIDRANGVVTDWVGAADSPSTPRPEKQWVSAIHEDRSGTMWLGTNSRGLYYRRSGWSEFRRYPNQPSVNGPIWISDIIEDSDGRLWIVSRTSIDLMDAETGNLTPVYPNPIGGFLHGGAEGHDGTMWFVSAGSGLLHVDRNGREIERFVSDPLDPTGLRDNALLSVHPSRAEPGIIWFGGVDVGLGRFDLATRDFKFYGMDDGLPNNMVYGILEDDDGMLWLSTNFGIARFVPATGSFSTYGVEDGAQSEEFNSGAFYRSPRTGELFFGGVAGLNVFHPDDIKPNEVPPQVAITGLRLLNEQIIPGPNSPLEKQLLVTDEVELNHSDKMFTFEFVGLHYVDPSRNKYQYMLDGFNEDWVSAGTENTATFTNLDPGRYSFKVKSANSDGVWSDTYASIGVTIKPPWWQTTWAYLSYGLLLLCSVVVVDRVQRKRVETRATARMLAAENERKTNELEHAREVQLSLLPQVPPKVPGIEIAAGMRTATEVGGDYYDFNVAEDGALVIAIGDATGHGLSAGTVVSATKGIFSLVANESDIELAMDSCARGVRRLGLQKLFMAFALVRIADYCLEVVGGGMPPALVYRADTGTVEEISLSGLPLGSPRNGQYRKTAVPLKPGDTVLLMSDGFPELFNGGREMLGYDRARSELAKVGSSSADAVLQHFHSVCEEWTQNAVVGDDVTFVVLKVNYAS